MIGQAGDEVFGTMDVKHPGAFAETLVTQSRYITKKLSQISFAEAACLPIPGTVAWAALFVKGNVSRNSRIIINDCMGAVGSMAVQLAMAKGALVAGTCSRGKPGQYFFFIVYCGKIRQSILFKQYL